MPTPVNAKIQRSEPNLLIIGASARYAAQSAVRAGIGCSAIDLFADWDLRQVAPVVAVENFSEKEVRRAVNALQFKPRAFVIAGGMETRPELIKSLTAEMQLLGSTVDRIVQSKDPFEVQRMAARTSISYPPTCLPHSVGIGTAERWLSKPICGVGGWGVQELSREYLTKKTDERADSIIWQRRIAGRSYSSVFCASGRGAHLIGSTEQLLGIVSFAPAGRPYQYCGSIGPMDFNSVITEELFRIGESIVSGFGLLGIFGVDWILDDEEKVWLIEINPRITSSCEIFEQTGVCQSMLALHLNAIVGNAVSKLLPPQQMAGKAILFSKHQQRFEVGEALFRNLVDEYYCQHPPKIADIPNSGSAIDFRDPILTLLAYGESANEARQRLVGQATEIDRLIDCLTANSSRPGGRYD